MKTIVVGYDNTEPAQRALERAADLGKAFGSQLVVTSVVPVTTPAAGRSIGTDPTDPPEDHVAELEAARSYLAGRDMQADYIEAFGHPGDALVAAAEERKADLIVVGTRELGVIQRLLGSSVSNAVARHAHCDVLIVH